MGGWGGVIPKARPLSKGEASQEDVSRSTDAGGPGEAFYQAAVLTVGSLKAQPGRKGSAGPRSELMAAAALLPLRATPSPWQPPGLPPTAHAPALGARMRAGASGRGCHGNGRARVLGCGPGRPRGPSGVALWEPSCHSWG